jgi:hypothetical protein
MGSGEPQTAGRIPLIRAALRTVNSRRYHCHVPSYSHRYCLRIFAVVEPLGCSNAGSVVRPYSFRGRPKVRLHHGTPQTATGDSASALGAVELHRQGRQWPGLAGSQRQRPAAVQRFVGFLAQSGVQAPLASFCEGTYWDRLSELVWGVGYAFLEVLLLCALIAGCASASAEIRPSYVSPRSGQNLSCKQLGAEAERVSRRASGVAGVQDSNKTSDAWVTGAAIVLFWPAAFFVKAEGPTAAELARLRVNSKRVS